MTVQMQPAGPDGVVERGPELVEALPSRFRGVVVEVGQVGQLTAALVKSAVSRPTGYWADTLEEMYGLLRFCYISVLLCVGGFCFLIGNYAYNILTLVGAPNRLGFFFVFATAREIAPFCTGMAVAGVMGTAMTADLGARKVREELDALKVLGMDVVRTLVLPRVLAITIMTVAFNLVGIAIGVVLAALAGCAIGIVSYGAFFDIFLANMTAPELGGTIIKTTLIGLFIGIVCAQKGLNSKGGAEGVGRAVNQAVVLCFAAVWIFNFIVNAVLLGLNPDMLINR
jgi:phospholipid/cholesterol/gamma-HCH transport system permease protein